MIICVNINGFSPNLVCVLISWRSALVLLIGKFRQILTVICPRRPYFSFPGDNLSKWQGILTKPGTSIDMKEIWFGIANGQISPMFDRVICPRHDNGGALEFNVSFISFKERSNSDIMKTCLYNFDPLKPHFIYSKTGVYRGKHFSYFCSKT